MPSLDKISKKVDAIAEAYEAKVKRSHAVDVPTDPVEWGAQLSITWDPWQLSVLNKLEDSQKNHTPLRVCIPASRQIGKDYCLAACLLMHAETTKNAVCLSIGPSLRQSSLLMRRVYQFYHAQGSSAPKAVSEQQTQLKLANGSYILSLPSSEQTVRGVSSVSLLVLNECASLEEPLIYALTPMLSTVPDSRIFAAGTPRGKSGFFYETCKGAPENGWTKYEIKATDCKRITPEWLDEERQRLGPFFDREYMVSWGSIGAGSIFSEAAMKRCIVDRDVSLERRINAALDGTYEADYENEDTEDDFGFDNLNIEGI
jgi:hypothetical protein